MATNTPGAGRARARSPAAVRRAPTRRARRARTAPASPGTAQGDGRSPPAPGRDRPRTRAGAMCLGHRESGAAQPRRPCPSRSGGTAGTGPRSIAGSATVPRAAAPPPGGRTWARSRSARRPSAATARARERAPASARTGCCDVGSLGARPRSSSLIAARTTSRGAVDGAAGSTTTILRILASSRHPLTRARTVAGPCHTGSTTTTPADATANSAARHGSGAFTRSCGRSPRADDPRVQVIRRGTSARCWRSPPLVEATASS